MGAEPRGTGHDRGDAGGVPERQGTQRLFHAGERGRRGPLEATLIDPECQSFELGALGWIGMGEAAIGAAACAASSPPAGGPCDGRDQPVDADHAKQQGGPGADQEPGAPPPAPREARERSRHGEPGDYGSSR